MFTLLWGAVSNFVASWKVGFEVLFKVLESSGPSSRDVFCPLRRLRGGSCFRHFGLCLSNRLKQRQTFPLHQPFHFIKAFLHKVHVFFINLVHVDGVGNLVFLPHYLTAQNCNAHYGTGGKIIGIIPLCVFEPDIQINVFGKKIISVTSIGKFFYQNIFDGFKSALAEQTVIFIFFAVLINFFQSRLLRRF